ncbi:hypothetical protein EC957_010653, partial [Mortierella hygrophila]
MALPVDMHPNVKMVLQDQQRVLVRQGEIMGRLPGSLENMEREVQGLRRTAAERLDQAMMYVDALFDCGMSYFKDTVSRVESKLDYLMSRLGPSALGSVPPHWESYSALSYQPYPVPSCQHAFGSTPALAVSTAFQAHSEQLGPSSFPRRLAQAPVTALVPRWTPVAQSQSQSQSQPQSQSQRIPLQTVPVQQQQPSMTMTTTETTTTTTATTTSTSVTTGVTVSVNYRLGNVAAIWEEYQKFEQERQKAGKKSMGISRKHQKQLNNKKRVVEEVEYLAGQIRATDEGLNQQDAIQKAMSELDAMFKA